MEDKSVSQPAKICICAFREDRQGRHLCNLRAFVPRWLPSPASLVFTLLYPGTRTTLGQEPRDVEYSDGFSPREAPQLSIQR